MVERIEDGELVRGPDFGGVSPSKVAIVSAKGTGLVVAIGCESLLGVPNVRRYDERDETLPPALIAGVKRWAARTKESIE